MSKNRKFIIIAAAFLVVSTGIVFSVKGALGANGNTMAASSRSAAVQSQDEIQDEIYEEEKLLLTKAPVKSVHENTEKKPSIISYTVKSGDSLGLIAERNGSSIRAIAASNGISENSILREGQELRFPSIKGVLYKIKKGETLWDISFANDVSVEKIVEANSLDSPDKLKIGQEIILPGIDKIKPVNNGAEATVASAQNTSKASGSVKPPTVRLASRSGQATAASDNSLSGMIWPLKGRITSGFGPRGEGFHKGIDIAAPVETDIKAALSGTVIYSGWMNGFGNTVILSHGNGIETYYGHNSENLVSVGQTVEKGQVIAKLGNSGRSTGPHVEFGIRKNGTPVNPMIYLK